MRIIRGCVKGDAIDRIRVWELMGGDSDPVDPITFSRA
jgi:hypothetical protein